MNVTDPFNANNSNNKISNESTNDSGISSSSHCHVDVKNISVKEISVKIGLINEVSTDEENNDDVILSDCNQGKLCSKTLRSALIKTCINSAGIRETHESDILNQKEIEKVNNLSTSSTYYSTNKENQSQYYCDLDILKRRNGERNMSKSDISDIKTNFMQKIRNKITNDASTNSIVQKTTYDTQYADLLLKDDKSGRNRHRKMSHDKRKENSMRSPDESHRKHNKRGRSREIIKINPIRLSGDVQNEQDVYYLVMEKKRDKRKSNNYDNAAVIDLIDRAPDRDVNDNLTTNDIMNAINKKLINSATDSIKSEAIKQHIYENALKNKSIRNYVMDKTVSIEIMNKCNIDKLLNSSGVKSSNIKSFENIFENSSKISKEPDVFDLGSDVTCRRAVQEDVHEKSNRHHRRHHSRHRRENKLSQNSLSRKREKHKSSSPRKEPKLSLSPKTRKESLPCQDVPAVLTAKSVVKETKITSETKEEKPKDKKKHKKVHRRSRSREKRVKSKYRKEMSFTELNLTPVLDFYKSTLNVVPDKEVAIKSTRKLSPNRDLSNNSMNDTSSVECYRSFSKSSSTTRKCEKSRKRCKNKRDKQSSISDIITKKEKNKHKLQHHILANYFDHAQLKRSVYSSKKVISTDRLIEISTKALDEDGSTTLGFTVEGIEPPKRLEHKDRQTDSDTSKNEKQLKKLHFTCFPVLEIVSNSADLCNPIICFDELKQIKLTKERKCSIDRSNEINNEITKSRTRASSKERSKSVERMENDADKGATRSEEDNVTVGDTSSTSQSFDQKKKIHKLFKYTMQKRTKARDLRSDKIDTLYDKRQMKRDTEKALSKTLSKKKKCQKTIKAKEEPSQQLNTNAVKSTNKNPNADFCLHETVAKSSSCLKTDKNVSNLEIINEESQSHYSSTDTDIISKMVKKKRLVQSLTTIKNEESKQSSNLVNVTDMNKTSETLPTVKRRLPSQIPKLKSSNIPSKRKRNKLDELYTILCANNGDKDKIPSHNLEESLDRLINYLENVKENRKSDSKDDTSKASENNFQIDHQHLNQFKCCSQSYKDTCELEMFTDNGENDKGDGLEKRNSERGNSIANFITYLTQSNMDLSKRSSSNYDTSQTNNCYENIVQTYGMLADKAKLDAETKAETYYNSPEFKAKMVKHGYTEADLVKEHPTGDSLRGFNTPGFSCMSLVCCVCKKMLNCCEHKPLSIDESAQYLADEKSQSLSPPPSPSPIESPQQFKMPTIIRPVKNTAKSQTVQTNITLTQEIKNPFKASSITTVCSYRSDRSISPNSSVSFLDNNKRTNKQSYKSKIFSESTSEDTIDDKKKFKRNRVRRRNASLSKAISITEVSQPNQASEQRQAQEKVKNNQSFLVMSTTSSYTVCSNPSEFLTKIENQLKRDKMLMSKRPKNWEEVVNDKSSTFNLKSKLFTHDSFTHLGHVSSNDDFILSSRKPSSENFILKYLKSLFSQTSKQQIMKNVIINEETLMSVLDVLRNESYKFLATNSKKEVLRKEIIDKMFADKYARRETIGKKSDVNFEQVSKPIVHDSSQFIASMQPYQFYLHHNTTDDQSKCIRPSTAAMDEIEFSVDSLESANRIGLLQRKRNAKQRSFMTFQKPAPNTYFVYNALIETNSPFMEKKNDDVQSDTIRDETITQTANIDVSSAHTSEESGYESGKTKKATLKSIFTKGRLLDIFKMKRKNHKIIDDDVITNRITDTTTTDLSTTDEPLRSDNETNAIKHKKYFSTWANVGRRIYKFNKTDNEKIYSCKLSGANSNSSVSVTSSKKKKFYTIDFNTTKNEIKRFSDYTSDTDQTSNPFANQTDNITDVIGETSTCTSERDNNENSSSARSIITENDINNEDNIKEENNVNETNTIDNAGFVKKKFYTINFNQSKTTIKTFADYTTKLSKIVDRKETDAKLANPCFNLRDRFLKLKAARDKFANPSRVITHSIIHDHKDNLTELNNVNLVATCSKAEDTSISNENETTPKKISRIPIRKSAKKIDQTLFKTITDILKLNIPEDDEEVSKLKMKKVELQETSAKNPHETTIISNNDKLPMQNEESNSNAIETVYFNETPSPDDADPKQSTIEEKSNETLSQNNCEELTIVKNNECKRLKVKLEQALNILNSKENFSVTTIDVQYFQNLIENDKNLLDEDDNLPISNTLSSLYRRYLNDTELDKTNLYEGLLKLIRNLDEKSKSEFLCDVYNVEEDKSTCSEFCNLNVTSKKCRISTDKTQQNNEKEIKPKRKRSSSCCSSLNNQRMKENSIDKENVTKTKQEQRKREKNIEKVNVMDESQTNAETSKIVESKKKEKKIVKVNVIDESQTNAETSKIVESKKKEKKIVKVNVIDESQTNAETSKIVESTKKEKDIEKVNVIDENQTSGETSKIVKETKVKKEKPSKPSKPQKYHEKSKKICNKERCFNEFKKTYDKERLEKMEKVTPLDVKLEKQSDSETSAETFKAKAEVLLMKSDEEIDIEKRPQGMNEIEGDSGLETQEKIIVSNLDDESVTEILKPHILNELPVKHLFVDDHGEDVTLDSNEFRDNHKKVQTDGKGNLDKDETNRIIENDKTNDETTDEEEENKDTNVLNAGYPRGPRIQKHVHIKEIDTNPDDNVNAQEQHVSYKNEDDLKGIEVKEDEEIYAKKIDEKLHDRKYFDIKVQLNEKIQEKEQEKESEDVVLTHESLIRRDGEHLDVDNKHIKIQDSIQNIMAEERLELENQDDLHTQVYEHSEKKEAKKNEFENIDKSKRRTRPSLLNVKDSFEMLIEERSNILLKTDTGCKCDRTNTNKKNKRCQCSVLMENSTYFDDDTVVAHKIVTKSVSFHDEFAIKSDEKQKHPKNKEKRKREKHKPEKKQVVDATTSTNSKKKCKDVNCKHLKPDSFNDKYCGCVKNHNCNCHVIKEFTKQVKQCQEYAAKIRLESEMKREGYWKQYNDFKEIPLHILLGRAPPSYQYPKAPTVQKRHGILVTADKDITVDKPTEEIRIMEEEDTEDRISETQISETSVGLEDSTLLRRTESHLEVIDSDLREPSETYYDKLMYETEAEEEEPTSESKTFSQVNSSITNAMKSNLEIGFVDPMDDKPKGEVSSFIEVRETIALRSKKKTDAEVKKLLHIEDEILTKESKTDVKVSDISIEKIDTEDKVKLKRKGSLERRQEKKELEETDDNQKTLDDVRKNLTDKEIFNKLLSSYEKEENLAEKLSFDEGFFSTQLSTVKSKESISKFMKDDTVKKVFETTKDQDKAYVDPQDIGTCFARGFRPHNITLTGDTCLNVVNQDKYYLRNRDLNESIIDFSERDTPLDYLLGLGFMVDEATNALKDEDVEHRLLAAITEARVWINQITTTQGTLLYLVAYKAKPKTMRYFLQLVEAIINRRITNAVKLDGFLRVLEKIEQGEIGMLRLFNDKQFEDEENEERLVKNQLREIFMTVYKTAENESFARGKKLPREAILLLRILAAKYRAGLNPHLELIATYIGRGSLKTEVQLEAAMIFLSRLDTADVKIKEFEKYCALS